YQNKVGRFCDSVRFLRGGYCCFFRNVCVQILRNGGVSRPAPDTESMHVCLCAASSGVLRRCAARASARPISRQVIRRNLCHRYSVLLTSYIIVLCLELNRGPMNDNEKRLHKRPTRLRTHATPMTLAHTAA